MGLVRMQSYGDVNLAPFALMTCGMGFYVTAQLPRFPYGWKKMASQSMEESLKSMLLYGICWAFLFTGVAMGLMDGDNYGDNTMVISLCTLMGAMFMGCEIALRAAIQSTYASGTQDGTKLETEWLKQSAKIYKCAGAGSLVFSFMFVHVFLALIVGMVHKERDAVLSIMGVSGFVFCLMLKTLLQHWTLGGKSEAFQVDSAGEVIYAGFAGLSWLLYWGTAAFTCGTLTSPTVVSST